MFLADLIKKAYKYNGIVTAYVYGEFGYGKTSYALWTAYEVYGSWRKALDHLFFRPKEVIEAIGKVIETDKRIPVIIMDDAGLWLDRLTWWETDKVRFMQLFNLIRSIASGVIFTTPSEELPKQILNKCFFRVKIEMASEDENPEIVREIGRLAKKFGLAPLVSKAIGYRLKTLPSFFKIIKKTYYDYYPTHYPVYEEYREKRREALKYYYKKLKASIEEAEGGKEFDPLVYIKRQLKKGVPRREIVKDLVRRGIPYSTAYYYIRKVEKALDHKG